VGGSLSHGAVSSGVEAGLFVQFNLFIHDLAVEHDRGTVAQDRDEHVAVAEIQEAEDEAGVAEKAGHVRDSYLWVTSIYSRVVYGHFTHAVRFVKKNPGRCAANVCMVFGSRWYTVFRWEESHDVA
jgi:hypothetical protein